MRPTFIVPIHGTWDFSNTNTGKWYLKNSAFASLCNKNGLYYRSPEEPFIWSGRIDGLGLKTFLTLGLSKDQHDDWKTAGFAARQYLKQFKVYERNLILHSHALQVACYADIQVNNVVSIGSPIRSDMMQEYLKFKNHCRNWMHIRDSKFDLMGTLGQVGDGKWFGTRECKVPGVVNHRLKGISHTRILNDIQHMLLWEKEGWFDFLRA